MMLKIKKHFWYYASLIAILSVGLCLIILNAHNKQLQMLTVVILAVSYVFSLFFISMAIKDKRNILLFVFVGTVTIFYSK